MLFQYWFPNVPLSVGLTPSVQSRLMLSWPFDTAHFNQIHLHLLDDKGEIHQKNQIVNALWLPHVLSKMDGKMKKKNITKSHGVGHKSTFLMQSTVIPQTWWGSEDTITAWLKARHWSQNSLILWAPTVESIMKPFQSFLWNTDVPQGC